MTFGYKTVEDDVLNIRNLEFVIHLNHNLLSELSSLLKIKGYLKYFNSLYSFENIHTAFIYRHTLNCRNNIAM